jgi:hypothetical protein
MIFKDFISGIKAKVSKKKNETYVSGERYAENSNIEFVEYRPSHVNSSLNMIAIPNYYRVHTTTPIDNNAPIALEENADLEKIYKRKINERIEKKPVEVYQELFEEIPKIDLIGINEKIKLVEKRIEYMKFLGGQTGDERIALRYLYARKHFDKYGKLFTWPVTTKAKIDELCNKYKLSDESFHSYSKTIPMEAIYELEKFVNAWNKVTKKGKGDEKPSLHLIIEDTPESKNSGERKKDPILYAESPFGKWFYVLGAWDKEVQYVDEIVYRGK